MPLLHDDAECCVLRIGTYTLGGNGADALPITRLESSPRVATIVVPAVGPPTIQRLTAAVVVRLDQTPIGIAPKPLLDGVEIEFGDCRLTFRSDEHGAMSIMSAGNANEAEPWSASEASAPAVPPASATVLHARLVNVRTGDLIDLENRRIVIGRDESCDVVVPGMRVSRRHCSIAPVQGGYLLRDESANGTIVNGKRMSGTYLLGHGDVVRLDEEDLRFEIDGLAPAPASTEAAPTTVLDLSYVRTAAAMDVTSETAVPPTATLEVVKGHYAGASFQIDRPVCAIGRGPQCDVRIRDEGISANHATLLRKGTSWFIVDLRSSNGTFVDGSRVAGEREIRSGARLKLGAVELEFRCVECTTAPVERKQKGSWLRRLYQTVAGASGEGPRP